MNEGPIYKGCKQCPPFIESWTDRVHIEGPLNAGDLQKVL